MMKDMLVFGGDLISLIVVVDQLIDIKLIKSKIIRSDDNHNLVLIRQL